MPMIVKILSISALDNFSGDSIEISAKRFLGRLYHFHFRKASFHRCHSNWNRHANIGQSIQLRKQAWKVTFAWSKSSDTEYRWLQQGEWNAATKPSKGYRVGLIPLSREERGQVFVELGYLPPHAPERERTKRVKELSSTLVILCIYSLFFIRSWFE